MCPTTKRPCPQLGFDQSIKMPVGNIWAWGGALRFTWLGHREEQESLGNAVGDGRELQEREREREPTSHVKIPAGGHLPLTQLGLG